MARPPNQTSKEAKLQALRAHHALLKANLPHLHGQKMYSWQRRFFESDNRMTLLCAANQIGKSSIQIRKCIHWATNPQLWPKLWPKSPKPRQIWYLYPSRDVASSEFELKWVPDFLPKEPFHDHPQYGWEPIASGKNILGIRFKSGVVLYFHTYSQDVKDLQTGTVHAIFCDEELPANIFPELQQRLAAKDIRGYYSMVFTATLNQELWRLAMEAQGQETEMFKSADKWQISKFDCLFYEDNSPSGLTEVEIEEDIAMCSSPQEVARRIYGRFVSESGRKYHAFSPDIHYMKPTGVSGDWKVYASVDPGSGGPTGHPAAMVFLALRPDRREGWVIRGWRGGKNETTTAGDVLDKFREIKQGLKPVSQVYDPAAKDFYTIAIRQGEAFTKAQKKHEEGEDIVNTLFKNNMLKIFDQVPLRPLGDELLTLMNMTLKRNAKDDYSDALRYCCMSVHWDFSWIKKESEAILSERALKDQATMYIPTNDEIRRGIHKDPFLVEESVWEDYSEEIRFLNEEYGS